MVKLMDTPANAKTVWATDRHRKAFYHRLMTESCVESPSDSEDNKSEEDHGRVEHHEHRYTQAYGSMTA